MDGEAWAWMLLGLALLAVGARLLVAARLREALPALGAALIAAAIARARWAGRQSARRDDARGAAREHARRVTEVLDEYEEGRAVRSSQDLAELLEGEQQEDERWR